MIYPFKINGLLQPALRYIKGTQSFYFLLSNLNPTVMQDMINDGYTDILIDILATAQESEQ